MKIAFVSGNEALGGSERGMQRLLQGLANEKDVSVRLFVDRIDLPRSGAVSFTERGLVGSLVEVAARHRGWTSKKAWRQRVAERNRKNLFRLLGEWGPDLIHLHNVNHWTGTGFRRDIAADLTALAPVVWTHHDLWGLTGCCDYPEDCRSAEQGLRCGWDDGLKLTAGQSVEGPRAGEWKALQAAAGAITHVCTARWNAENVRKIFGTTARTVVIPYDLDTKVFAPLDRQAARAALGIQTAFPVIAAVASNLSVKRKGLQHLLDALKQVGPEHRLVLMGAVRDQDKKNFPAGTCFLGSLTDDRLLRQAYCAADLLVVPSLAEAFGQILSEAMACGIPAVAYDAGGIPEVVGSDGWLVPCGDTAKLAETISDFLAGTLPNQARVVAGLRAAAERRFSMGQQAAAHLALYRELLS